MEQTIIIRYDENTKQVTLFNPQHGIHIVIRATRFASLFGYKLMSELRKATADDIVDDCELTIDFTPIVRN